METSYVYISNNIFLFWKETVTWCKDWCEVTASSLLNHDGLLGSMMTWWERKPQPSKPYHREENNEPLVLSTKVHPWVDSGLALLLCSCFASKLVTIIWWSKERNCKHIWISLNWYVFFAPHFLTLQKEIICFQPWIFYIILQTFKGIWITQKQTQDLS